MANELLSAKMGSVTLGITEDLEFNRNISSAKPDNWENIDWPGKPLSAAGYFRDARKSIPLVEEDFVVNTSYKAEIANNPDRVSITLCEKPYIPSDYIKDTNLFYPLDGSQIRGYRMSSYFGVDGNNNGLFQRESDKENNPAKTWDWEENTEYLRRVGTTWEGSFSSISDLSRNLLLEGWDGDWKNYPKDEWNPVVSETKYSILGGKDRFSLSSSNQIYFQKNLGDNVDTSKTYCFSLYIRGDSNNPITCKGDGATWGVSHDVKSDYYTRLYFTGTFSSFKVLRVEFGGATGLSLLDVCGMCLNEGSYPIGIDYRTLGMIHPLVFANSDLDFTLIENGNWTLKYIRKVFGATDMIGSHKITKHLSGVEFVTIRHKANSSNVEVSIVSDSGETATEDIPFNFSTDFPKLGPKNEAEPTESDPNPDPDSKKKECNLILGGTVSKDSTGEYKYTSTPGIYRDLMVFPNDYLNDTQVKELDNSLMAIQYLEHYKDEYDKERDGYTPESIDDTILRSSLFEEFYK